ncbi:MAG: hypothetical protein F6K32_06285 [Desertifilum sp. SIO1I2]|nr:hypothetical protein [Desertifilum sp. SIO1I2]
MRIPTSVISINLLVVALLASAPELGFSSARFVKFTTSPHLFSDTESAGQTDDHRGSGRLGQIQLTNLTIPRG